MEIPIYIVDTFANHVFGGNPAAVCILEDWLDDDILLAIANENRQPITSFIVRRHHDFHLRWFTPMKEHGLCGHGTLAAGFVVLKYISHKGEHALFHTRYGDLVVSNDKDHGYRMDLPTLNYEAIDIPEFVKKGLGSLPIEAYQADNKLMLLFKNEKEIREIQPSIDLISKLNYRGIIITARGDHVDFVSRYFIIENDMIEDAVTGTNHCILTPYWSEKLTKTKLHAKQLSHRQGDIFCELKGEHSIIKGQVTSYLRGKLDLFNHV